MNELFSAIWVLGNEMGIYIISGLLLAGVLHQLIHESTIKRHLGKNNSSSVYKAALFGTPLPLCSCSVVPFAVSLRKNGASKGSTLSFLISTPITGIDSILATFGMFGFAFMLYRTLSSVIIAVSAGIIMNLFDTNTTPNKFTLQPNSNKPTKLVFTKQEESKKELFSIKKVFTYGFNTLFASFAKPMALGLIAGAFLTTVFEPNMLATLSENRALQYLLAIAIATPMYVCATASLPIAASLVMAGVSPGAAFVFLSAGPATNTVTMGVVKAELGGIALGVYLGVIIVGSLLFGAVIDITFDALSVPPLFAPHEHYGIFSQFGAVILFVLILWHITAPLFKKKDSSCSGGSCCSQH